MLYSSSCALGRVANIDEGLGWLVLLFGGLPTLFGIILFLTGRKLLALHAPDPSLTPEHEPTAAEYGNEAAALPLNGDLQKHLRFREKLDSAIIWIGVMIALASVSPIFLQDFGHPVGLGVYLWFFWIPVVLGVMVIIGGWWKPSSKASRLRTIGGLALCGISVGAASYLWFFTALQTINLARVDPLDVLVLCLSTFAPAGYFLVGIKFVMARSVARHINE